MKKGQTEMLGLVILVLLISIAAIFAVRFIFTGKEAIGPEIKLQTQASNLQSALINMDIDQETTFQDIVVECCESNNCGFLSQETPKLIEYLLPEQDYEFSISSINRNCFESPKKCEKDKVTSSRRITKEQSSYNFIVSLCINS